MDGKQILALGYEPGPVVAAALVASNNSDEPVEVVEARLAAVLDAPEDFVEDGEYGEVARLLVERQEREAAKPDGPGLRDEPVPYRQWGDDLEPQSVEQMRQAVRSPVAVRGALMPDAHLGYGLPIGGVLATRGAVIPYAVGVDIACRMRLSVYDVPGKQLDGMREKLGKILERETAFGIGAQLKKQADHEVMERDWSITDVTKDAQRNAAKQLGSSGSGNHFVEFGTLTLDHDDLGLPAGTYLALLSHSGSRGAGAKVCAHYSKLAMNACPQLEGQAKNLAWLDLDSEAGAEYWAAMNLMGAYAAANHEVIHDRVARALGEKVAAHVENHHNFAWKETHDGEEVIVHRKGATPAGRGVLGVIPGSMATPGYVVRGLGSAASLNSASHGAGRVMSRTKAKNSFRWSHVKQQLADAGITLLSAGIDENPRVYKDIETVMAQQTDLVERVARFDPKVVKMADGKDRAED